MGKQKMMTREVGNLFYILNPLYCCIYHNDILFPFQMKYKLKYTGSYAENSLKSQCQRDLSTGCDKLIPLW